jgi:hypothetical protein
MLPVLGRLGIGAGGTTTRRPRHEAIEACRSETRIAGAHLRDGDAQIAGLVDLPVADGRISLLERSRAELEIRESSSLQPESRANLASSRSERVAIRFRLRPAKRRTKPASSMRTAGWCSPSASLSAASRPLSRSGAFCASSSASRLGPSPSTGHLSARYCAGVATGWLG